MRTSIVWAVTVMRRAALTGLAAQAWRAVCFPCIGTATKAGEVNVALIIVTGCLDVGTARSCSAANLLSWALERAHVTWRHNENTRRGADETRAKRADVMFEKAIRFGKCAQKRGPWA